MQFYAGGSFRFVAGGHQDSAPRHIGGHVLHKYSCVESPGLKTTGQIHPHRQSICPVPGLNEPPVYALFLWFIMQSNQPKKQGERGGEKER